MEFACVLGHKPSRSRMVLGPDDQITSPLSDHVDPGAAVYLPCTVYFDHGDGFLERGTLAAQRFGMEWTRTPRLSITSLTRHSDAAVVPKGSGRWALYGRNARSCIRRAPEGMIGITGLLQRERQMSTARTSAPSQGGQEQFAWNLIRPSIYSVCFVPC
jgi:hypothetical protein